MKRFLDMKHKQRIYANIIRQLTNTSEYLIRSDIFFVRKFEYFLYQTLYKDHYKLMLTIRAHLAYEPVKSGLHRIFRIWKATDYIDSCLSSERVVLNWPVCSVDSDKCKVWAASGNTWYIYITYKDVYTARVCFVAYLHIVNILTANESTYNPVTSKRLPFQSRHCW